MAIYRLLGMVQLLLIMFKLTGVIDWHWAIVFVIWESCLLYGFIDGFIDSFVKAYKESYKR
jgi:thiosulfate reductase cytochrome b subunit